MLYWISSSVICLWLSLLLISGYSYSNSTTVKIKGIEGCWEEFVPSLVIGTGTFVQNCLATASNNEKINIRVNDLKRLSEELEVKRKCLIDSCVFLQGGI